MTSTLLITGANGFVGAQLCTTAAPHFFVKGAVRSAQALVDHTETVLIDSIDSTTDWTTALQGVDVVVHLAARVHVMNDHSADPLAEFRNVNVNGSLNLAKQAAQAGVQRFVFISSIKVNGESTALGQPFHADDEPQPMDAYGISKREAEDALRQLAGDTGMEVVIIRPPLVYGAGVKANFRSMMRWLHKGIPLPLGAIANQRSLVALDNLVDLIITCISHPAAANQTFLVSDGEDLSTSELLRRMANALGKSARLLPIPAWLLQFGASLLGKGAVAQRLCGSLQLDISKTRQLLHWTPPVTVTEALQKTAHSYRSSL
ncbi:MAG: SDR family oxidoreductase [Methylococcales bacterium]|nr:SDR family oxidoreductase [Methylococcales bacterium]MDP3840501.1 SDR family oxidoreductase [Methylococcales bacterium]